MADFLTLAVLPDTLAAAPMRLALVGALLVAVFAVAAAALFVGKRAQAARAAQDMSALTGTQTGAHLGGDVSVSGDWWADAAGEAVEVEGVHPQTWQSAFLGQDEPSANAPAAAPFYPQARHLAAAPDVAMVTPAPVPVPPVAVGEPVVDEPVPATEVAVEPAAPVAAEVPAAEVVVEPVVYVPAPVPAPAPALASEFERERVDGTPAPAVAPVEVFTAAPISLDVPAAAPSADTWGAGETGDDDEISPTWWQNAIADERS